VSARLNQANHVAGVVERDVRPAPEDGQEAMCREDSILQRERL
jgi:hypothetical protein